MTSIAHIVNPVQVQEASDLYVAQPITFESMRVAQRFAQDRVEVSLFTTQFAEDAPVLPTGFHHTPDLEESVLDHGSFRKQRKLPLLRGILDRLCEATRADYMIYTNVDIGLLPSFYLTVDRLIEADYDAFVINRRTISNQYSHVEQLPLIYAEVGKAHRGWDCFVFKREAYSAYELGTLCVGAPRVGLGLLANLVAHANHFKEFKDMHLTFHVGDDRRWRGGEYSDYADHNEREVLAILDALESKGGAFDPSSPPGSFLLKRKRFGPAYEFWARNVDVSLEVKERLVRILGSQK